MVRFATKPAPSALHHEDSEIPPSFIPSFILSIQKWVVQVSVAYSNEIFTFSGKKLLIHLLNCRMNRCSRTLSKCDFIRNRPPCNRQKTGLSPYAFPISHNVHVWPFRPLPVLHTHSRRMAVLKFANRQNPTLHHFIQVGFFSVHHIKPRVID